MTVKNLNKCTFRSLDQNFTKATKIKNNSKYKISGRQKRLFHEH